MFHLVLPPLFFFLYIMHLELYALDFFFSRREMNKAQCISELTSIPRGVTPHLKAY